MMTTCDINEANAFLLQKNLVHANSSETGDNLSTHAQESTQSKILLFEQVHCEDSDGNVNQDITNSFRDNWYSDKSPELSGCPFKSFHHSGLASEFIQYHATDKKSQHILAGISDHSSSIFMKVQFIVNNLKDCLGIWKQLFIEKLNAIIVNADHVTVRAVLSKDDFAILRELVTYYISARKCETVFRYWCLLYNAFSRNLIPVLPPTLKNQLMAQLQLDFSLAAHNLCRCKLDIPCSNECELDDEHRKINDLTQMNVTAILMYYVTCKVGDYSNDIYKETPTKLNAEKFIKGTLVHLYIKLYENSSPTTASSSSAAVLMEIISHVLVAFHNNIPLEKNLFSSAIEIMLDMGCLSAALKMKNMLLNLVETESDFFQRGTGSKLVFIEPEMQIGFVTMGVSSTIKCLDALIFNIEYPVITKLEQGHLMNLMIAMQTYLGESGVWNGEYENTYLHCRHLQCTLEKKLGFQMADVKLDSDSETANDSGIQQYSDNFLADSSESSKTSQSKLQTSIASKLDEHTVDDWIVNAKSISKLRKGYAHEIVDPIQQQPNCFSIWISKTFELFVTCGTCCTYDLD